MIPALDPERRNKRHQESYRWRDRSPSSFNLESAKGSLGHHLAFILDPAGDYLLLPEEATSSTFHYGFRIETKETMSSL